MSEDDFLKMFEEELGEDLDQSDDFIREFEDEIAQDEMEYEQVSDILMTMVEKKYDVEYFEPEQ